MRRMGVTLALIALAACTCAPGAAAQAQPKLAQGANVSFPKRSFVLTLPRGVSVEPRGVHVRENGRPVSDLVSVPAQAAEQSGTVLVLDASDSMRGDAIRDAMIAARAFARERNPDQRLGVIAFNRAIETPAPLTSDKGSIDSALADPPALRSGTHIYDAVSSAISMLESEGVAAGSVVVLSDGADTGSRTGLAQLGKHARAAGIRIFAVGLHSRSFDMTTLRGLAAEAHGEYSEARSPRDLAPIYQGLGVRLAHELLLTYRSPWPRGTRVVVAASAAGVGGLATISYVTPLPHAVGERASGNSGFWASATAMIGASLLAGLLLAVATILLLVVRRGRALRTRMGGFVSLPEGVGAIAWGSALAGSLLDRADVSLERTKLWEAFREDLTVARIPMPAVQVVAWGIGATLAVAWILSAATGSTAAAVLAVCVPLAMRLAIKRRLLQQRRAFGDQLADNLQVLASAMRAGHSFIGALSAAANDAAEPARTEFRRVVADEQLGVPLEEALGVVMRRMQNTDLEQIVLVAMLQRDTGGNTAEVVDRVAATIRERAELRRMVDSLTAQGRLSRWVVSSLPVILLVLLTAINPNYMDPLYNTSGGRTMLVLAAGLVVLGSLAIKRIVTIKV
jgi:tight adherence protein B